MSRLLLDTHVVLWWMADHPALGAECRARVEAADVVMVSAASVWEIEIKRVLGKLAAPDDIVDDLRSAGFVTLAMDAEHARAAARLPRHHDDPFDRMLVAQAVAERCVLVTADGALAAYDVDRTDPRV